MKNKIYIFGSLAAIALLALASCKKDNPQTGVKVESVSFNESSYTIAENNLDLNLKKQLVVTPAGLLDTCKTLKWAVDDENIAEMNGSYLLPKGAGSVKVTATIQGSKSASCYVSITEVPVNGITLSNMTIKIGEKVKIEYTTDPENVPIQRFTLSSSKENVATIDADGIITAKRSGWTEIFATRGDLTAKCMITVTTVPVSGVKIDKTSFEFTSINETLQLTATIEPEDATDKEIHWSSSAPSVATVSDNGLVKCVGFGTATIQALSNNNRSASCEVTQTKMIMDCQGNLYPVVQIGTQWWMAENLRSTIYDTESNRKGEPVKTSSTAKFAPYYTDGRNTVTDYSGELTSDQRQKLGLLYNWGAVVGLATESDVKARTTSFSNRQGICPNGWHVPTSAEWITLEQHDGSEYYHVSLAGKKLKTKSGWFGDKDKDVSWDSTRGSDSYGFSALPAGYAVGSGVKEVGRYAYFWTATPDDSDKATCRYIFADYTDVKNKSFDKSNACSVRCVKN